MFENITLKILFSLPSSSSSSHGLMHILVKLIARSIYISIHSESAVQGWSSNERIVFPSCIKWSIQCYPPATSFHVHTWGNDERLTRLRIGKESCIGAFGRLLFVGVPSNLNILAPTTPTIRISIPVHVSLLHLSNNIIFKRERDDM